MNLFRRLFKSELKTLASTAVQLIPLNQIGGNEKVRKILIDHLIKKYGNIEAKKIISDSSYGVSELKPGSKTLSIIHMRGDQFLGSYSITNDKMEESEVINPSSREGRVISNYIK